MNSSEVEVKRKKIEKIAKWGLGLVGAVVISPFVFLAVKGIVGLALAGIIGMAVINFAPLVAMKFANWKLKGIKAEAAKNPVETLQNVFVEKQSALTIFETAITEFSTKVKNLEDKVESLRKKYPEEADKFEGHLQKMQAVLEARRRKYKTVKKALLDFSEEIKKAQVVWEVSQAAQEVTSAAGMGTDDPYERIKAETAVESVQNSLNKAISELETDLMNEDAEQEDEVKMLESKPRLPLNAAKIKVEVSR
jgi:DNA repair exonuclease SbcCD ATPase subunit